MKNKILYTLLFLQALAFTSCEEQLSLTPITTIAEEGYFKDANTIETGIIGVYDALQTAVLREFVLTEIRSDNTATVKNEGDFSSLNSLTESASNSIPTDYWAAQYAIIARANKVLKYTSVVKDATTRSKQEAELRFLRAYAHFNLVRLFGSVPLVVSEIGISDTGKFGASSVSDIYTFLEAELSDAAKYLPATRTGTELGRVTSVAANALLAQVKMAQGKTDGVTALLDAVIGDYTFDIEYADIFSLTNEMNKEVVFAVGFAKGINEGQDIAFECTAKGVFQGLNTPTDNLLAAYEAGDKRKDFSVSNGYCSKFAADITNDSGLDWIVIRKAEALLSRAEIVAKAASDVSQTAIDDINLLRKRAGLQEYTTASFASKDALLTAIANERRVELAFENDRWFTLLRTNKVAEVMSAHLGTTIPAESSLYYIPQREIDASQGMLKQTR